ncbi:hypothetical protein Taro_012300, partial [Colocasia esculenta]|nr:hypothetical protein [Colocasia esculenta]
MMSLTCPGVDLCQRGLRVASCGCPWKGGFLKLHNNGTLIRGRHSGARCRVSSAAPQTPPPVLEVPGAGSSSGGPISVSSLLEVVADDLQQLNKNLQSVGIVFLELLMNIEENLPTALLFIQFFYPTTRVMVC